jgi:ABC-2 type transport system ATP-binding protein
VLLTTHYMFEADELCDRIAVIAGGRIVAEGTPADLKAASAREPSSRSRCSATPGPRCGECRRCRASGRPAVEDRGHAQSLVVRAEPGAEVTQRVLALLTAYRSVGSPRASRRWRTRTSSG